jgi:uncharacterized protein YndB with AHSA1/START domain
MTDHSSEHATFVIERTYDAAPGRVFSAWSTKEAKGAWFGPRNASDTSYELDFRPGGEERFVVSGGGATYTYVGHLYEIVDDARIVYSYEMYRNEDRISVSLTTVELRDAEGGTALRYTEQGVYLDGHDTPALREEGTIGILEALGRALGAQAAG